MAEGKFRNLNNEEYWQERAETRTDKYWRKIGNVEKELAKQYRLALDDIRQMVIDQFEKYSTDQRITYQDAVKELTTYEMGDYKAKIDRLIPAIKATNDPFLIAELNKLQQVTKLTRFQALMAQIEGRLLELGYDQQMTMEEWLSGVYEGNYYESIYALQVGTGIGYGFVVLNENAIRTAITTPLHGDMFSSRIWDNKDNLVKNLRQVITQGLIKGESNQVMARHLKEKMNSNYANALRLVRTETANVLSESTNQGYKQSGYLSQYQLLATPSDRTCDTCMKLDGKVFSVDDKQAGLNASPIHPNCRCTEIPYFPEDDMEGIERYARVNEETFYVPANMSMKEFQDKYIKKSVLV